MEITDFKQLLTEEFGEDVVLSIDENATPKALVVDATKIQAICLFLRDHENSFFDMLSCLTAIDNGPEANTMEVIYNLYSIPHEHSLMLKTVIDRESSEIDSVESVWRTADWHEREAYDLLGVNFKGHPDLRRILMAADWEGHPLRQDYVEPETYRGMKTIREEGDPS
ncbi:NADH-quinone oxidoreductase subunit C [Reichenbachiella ulvae]|uniref:NADH-quinone oxidoreductase subunit C n=1 Tax=Reichenbachiella ulvae TaxID=2980104 RepID=A0ABT3CZE6_9BACT|nr:NADH-quinone oxidoreductase subunit C [Reichenbachiella ulvae]MCV9388949.1 NADH-quinone oxidoreductase subunit C [Reichenbachiella ulvae]